MERFFGAILAGRTVALAAADAKADQVAEMKELLAGAASDSPDILIPTGGTTGRLRWTRHTWRSLSAAADGFLTFFGEEAAVGVCVLPLHHVGGLMTIVRGVRGGGSVIFGDYRRIGKGVAVPPGATLSLVPTQLRRLLEDESACRAMRKAGRVLLGGARADPALLAAAREAGLPLAPCYGMTETAALVTALAPERFLAGESGVGDPLPHIELAWGQAPARGDFPSEARRLGVFSASLCHGYWPPSEVFDRNPWWTPDVAIPDSETGSLRILGRVDRTIISGGENVDPERVEAVLAEFPGVRAIRVLGLADADWGQRVVAAVEVSAKFDRSGWERWMREKLSPAERPKEILELPVLPRTAMGKIDLRGLVAAFGKSS